MASANEPDWTVRNRLKNEVGLTLRGIHVARVWWVIAPSNATATSP